jgi:predicted permease
MSQIVQVLRRLRRAPLFAIVILITLAAGVGATAAIFSVVEGVLLKPLPYPKADELAGVWLTAPGVNIKELNLSPSDYFIFRDQNNTFQDLGLFTGDSANVTGMAEPEQVNALLVTDGMLPILGISPMLGRWFTAQDVAPDSPDTVMLSYAYWRRKFGGDRSVIGRTLMVDGKSREVIGVMPQRFSFLGHDVQPIILPIKFDRNKTVLGNFSWQGIARLRPGATLAEASADVARMLPIVIRSFPPPPGFSLKLFEEVRIGPNLRPLKQDVVGDIGKVLWVLMGTIGLVLLIACANVANLLLVRAEGRHLELTIRAALGAGWGKIAAELTSESLALALLGGALGLGLAYGGLRALVAAAPAGLPRLGELGIDLPVLLFTLAISVAVGILLGLVPLFKYAGKNLMNGLRDAGRALSQGKERHRARSMLVVVQVALALVLLISSGLMIRTFRALTSVQPGFSNPGEIQTFRISIPETEVKEREAVVRMEEELLHKSEAIPGVSSVGIGTKIPMDDNGSFDPVFAEDHPYAEGELPPVRRFKFISPGFLRTMGMPVVAGRDLTWTDIYGKNQVILVSENLAREYWDDPQRALGKRVRVSTTGDWHEIIGVVADVRDDGVDQKAPTSVYWPIMTSKLYDKDPTVVRSVAFAIRSNRAGSESFIKEVQQTIWSVDPNLPIAELRTMADLYRKSMARTSFTLVLLAIAGGMALLLGIIGIYGVIAYSVAQRTREIGIRMALGAQRQELARMFVGHGLLLTAIGVACGLAAAFALMRLMASLLFEVSPADPVTYAAVSIGLIATAAIASYLPSRRAAGVDPVDALRAD